MNSVMKLPESLVQFLAEFNDDGSKYQLARPAEGTWTSLWKSHVNIANMKCISLEGGYTSTTADSHTLVINVTVHPMKLQNGAEDQANETITVYYRDFKTPEEAKAEMNRLMKSGLVGEDGSPLSIQLSTQRPAGTIAI